VLRFDDQVGLKYEKFWTRERLFEVSDAINTIPSPELKYNTHKGGKNK
jgi:hypothetical protein